MVATVAFTVYRPVHSALLPSLCTTTRELTSSNVVRGFLDSAGTLVGPALAGILLAVGDASVVFAACAGLSFAAAVTLARLDYEVPPSGEPGLRAVAGARDRRWRGGRRSGTGSSPSCSASGSRRPSSGAR